MKTALVMVALGVGVLGAATSACTKSLDEQRAAAQKAAAEAEEMARAAQQAKFAADEEQAELYAAIARDRTETIEKVEDAIRAVEQRMLELDPIIDTHERERLIQRRELLRADLAAIQKSTADSWAAVKVEVERHLRDDART